jgi:hypothetical protein
MHPTTWMRSLLGSGSRQTSACGKRKSGDFRYDPTWMGILLGVLATLLVGCAGDPGLPRDEARAKYPDEDYSTPEGWEAAAKKYYPPAALDYFEDVDAIGTADATGAHKLKLGPEEGKGRNARVLGAGGN